MVCDLLSLALCACVRVWPFLENIHRAHEIYRQELGKGGEKTGLALLGAGAVATQMAIDGNSIIALSVAAIAAVLVMGATLWKKRKLNKMDELLSADSLLYDVVLVQE
eukprot:GHVT01053517.1.p3 GENE.GHVT01053517.1~~GHVT01053517.1.p3  ORF type:complete len:108 (+),score=14.93 GHVT01053517.1:2072-2395(+)